MVGLPAQIYSFVTEAHTHKYICPKAHPSFSMLHTSSMQYWNAGNPNPIRIAP